MYVLSQFPLIPFYSVSSHLSLPHSHLQCELAVQSFSVIIPSYFAPATEVFFFPQCSVPALVLCARDCLVLPVVGN